MSEKARYVEPPNACEWLGCRLAPVGVAKFESGVSGRDDAIYVHQYQCLRCGRLFYFEGEANVRLPYFGGEPALN